MRPVDDALSEMRRRLFKEPCALDESHWEPCDEFTVRINDGPNYYILYKDIFRRGIYQFESLRGDPRILDCGSNIGLSVLYFKKAYPAARITAFEPDPEVLPLLRENLSHNGFDDVEVVAAALATRRQRVTMVADGKYASSLVQYATGGDLPTTTQTVEAVRLRDYLTEPIDFLKMNIEGAEADVLADSADRLHRVRAMAVEYHHLPGLRRSLHEILALLARTGFDYVIHDFDAETNPRSQPPFRLHADTRYFLLIYAQQRDD